MAGAMGAELFLALFSAAVLLPALALVIWGAILDGRADDEPTLAAVEDVQKARQIHTARDRAEL